MRSALVTALVARAESRRRVHARRFLTGLSSDELQFMAEFLGACTLESCAPQLTSREREQWREVKGRSEDWELKMILLQEYLYRSGLNSRSPGVPSDAR